MLKTIFGKGVKKELEPSEAPEYHFGVFAHNPRYPRLVTLLLSVLSCSRHQDLEFALLDDRGAAREHCYSHEGCMWWFSVARFVIISNDVPTHQASREAENRVPR